ncbi:mechanosensitive ion channel family protein [Aliifodinibius sp. S!AR15-10]|uniref:mechanosensitive ion channel family protein n=1 Tax=Aliifodinibius sp. S!AR15-10 TaxID=2950437 RepID=UPI002854FBEB|nr:mechanosensitive ion channel family protein [Aliifodinibius sp. S!AR15-10]MDR8393283.1 mechanosensitive ion channel family protein [Aliifodinibius sp. S!AR15-10]
MNITDATDAYKLIAGKLQSWLEAGIQMLPNLAVAVVVLIIFIVIGKLVRKAISKLLVKTTSNRTIINLLETVVGVLVVGIGIVFALQILQLEDTVTSILAGAGIIGLAIGFAFQDIASNFISGVMLSVRHPFGIGDIIETNGFYGKVQKLNLRNTILKTPQGQIVYIPNKSVFDSPLQNFTKGNERRIDLACGVSYGDDLEKARNLAVQAVESLDTIDKNRDVEFFYNEFGGSSINFVIRFWVDFHSNVDYWQAQSDAIIAIKGAFDENGIDIPFPIRTLDFGIKGGEKLSTMLVNGEEQ